MPSPAVALVGPVPPWRSGIADQTVRLARALKRIDAPPIVVTFRRMYPGFLFPGASDRDARGFPDDLDVRPLIDGFSPLSFRRAAKALASERVDVVLVPWWTVFFAPHDAILLRAIRGARPEVVRVLLCHNVADHEGGAGKRAVAHAVLRQADRLIVQNRGVADRLAAALAPRPV